MSQISDPQQSLAQS